MERMDTLWYMWHFVNVTVGDDDFRGKFFGWLWEVYMLHYSGFMFMIWIKEL
jgi:hypothetical protein